jgi:hypothetical protein
MADFNISGGRGVSDITKEKTHQQKILDTADWRVRWCNLSQWGVQFRYIYVPRILQCIAISVDADQTAAARFRRAANSGQLDRGWCHREGLGTLVVVMISWDGIALSPRVSGPASTKVQPAPTQHHACDCWFDLAVSGVPCTS